MDTETERLIHLVKQAQEENSEKYLVIAVPGFLGKKFIAYCSMREDLKSILQYVDTLRKDPGGIIKSALCFSLIALYGKCFTDASKNSYPKLEISNLSDAGNDNQETHEYLMNLRHQFVAHRGKTESEVGIAYMLISKTDFSERSQIRFSQLKQVSFSEQDLSKIETLVKCLITHVEDKIQKTGQKVHDDMLKLFTPEQLTLMMMNNAK